MIYDGPTPESQDLRDYLDATEIIDWKSAEIRLLAHVLVAGVASDVEQAKRLYEWVRDEISHSADAGHETVTCRASDALRHRTGICYAKAHLLAALLRAVGIPAGLCYQVLRYDDSSERLAVHGLNGIYLGSLGRWIRVDARGNKPGVDAQFCLEGEQLAFSVNPTLGEFTCETIFARPLPSIVRCLASHGTVAELMANLPGNIEQALKDEWTHPMTVRRATINDAEVISRLIMPLVKKFIAPEFSPVGQRNLLSSMEPTAIRGFFEAGYRYHVAEVEGQIVGVVGIRDNSHVHHLFVAEDFQRRGIARQLWEVARKECLAAGNPGNFTVWSSRYALDVYRRLGFVQAGPPETKDEVTAVPMKYERPCEKMLAARSTVDEIRPCNDGDFEATYSIINDGAQAYRSVIPEDR